MREGHPDQGHRKFWPLMKSMTWKERIEHIIYYYGKYALLAVFLIYMCISLGIDMFTPDPEVILSGTTVHVNLTAEMEDKLTDGAFEAVGGTDRKKQTAKLEPTIINNMDPQMLANLQAKFWTGDYHYVLMSQSGLELLLGAKIVPNLNEILSEERLAQWKDRLYTIPVGDTEIPMAIDITGTVLAQGCEYDGEKLYITFPAVVEKQGILEPFLTYLTEQGLLEIQ